MLCALARPNIWITSWIEGGLLPLLDYTLCPLYLTCALEPETTFINVYALLFCSVQNIHTGARRMKKDRAESAAVFRSEIHLFIAAHLSESDSSLAEMSDGLGK